jgi:hypothetical protein
MPSRFDRSTARSREVTTEPRKLLAFQLGDVRLLGHRGLRLDKAIGPPRRLHLGLVLGRRPHRGSSDGPDLRVLRIDGDGAGRCPSFGRNARLAV